MPMMHEYAASEPARADVDRLPGATVIEFGAPWCGFCLRAQEPLAQAFGPHAGLRHIKIEDGSGRPLGRSFRVKLWPTLVFLRDGKEVARLVRPATADEIGRAMATLESRAEPGESAG